MGRHGKTITARVPEQLADTIDTMADDEDRSRSEMIQRLVETGLEHYGDQDGDGPLAERPDTVLAGLLWDARRDIHTFVLITLVSAFATSVTGGIAATVFGAIAVLYALTVTVGIIDAVVLDSSLTLWAADTDPEPEGVET